MTLRTLPPDDLPALLALNNANARELSLLDLAGLQQRVDAAFYARAVEDQAALLIAFDQDAPIKGPNIDWFRARFTRFVYIDRVVVHPSQRRRALARALYADVIAAAERAGHGVLCCEVNAIPPNPVSTLFHAAMGFTTIGQAALPGREKSVTYLIRPLQR